MRLEGIIHSAETIRSPIAYANASFKTFPDTIVRESDTSVRFVYDDFQGDPVKDLVVLDIRNVQFITEDWYKGS